MKTLLLSTAILATSAFAVSAQDVFRGEADPAELRASELIGMRIYASETAMTVDETDGMQDDWEDIGEVGDIVLSRDGTAQAVLVDIGGFLGLGEREVAVSMDSLRFVSDGATADEASDFFLVMNASRADLEAAPDYAALGLATGAAATGAAIEGAAADTAAVGTEAVEETGEAMAAAGDQAAEGIDEAAETGAAMVDGEADAMATDAPTEGEMAADATAMAADGTATEGMAADEMATEEMATEEMATDGMATDEAATGDMAATGARVPLTREGYLAAAGEDLTADRLQGAAVYDAADERVGEVAELVLSTEGQINEVVVDVGGFLGIGEKPVALPMADLDILRQDGGDEIRVYLSQTREALDAMESYTAE